jgi:hypothetical protein
MPQKIKVMPFQMAQNFIDLLMKFFISFSLFVIASCLCAASNEIDSFFHCSYYGESTSTPLRLSPATAEAKKEIQNILDVIGLRANFEINAANVDNAAAIISGGKRYILYNPQFMNAINSAAHTDWARISILAHEIGHHLNGHTLGKGGSEPDLELEADEFSGFVLRKMGASLHDSQRAMEVAAANKQSKTHPAKKDRLASIAAGWNHANSQMKSGSSPVVSKNIDKPAIVEHPKKDQTVLAEKYIAFDARFYVDPKGLYYVTIRNHLVKIAGQDILIIGMLAQSNNKKYPLMFYDKEYNYMYINSSGQVYNSNGKKVGSMSAHK